MYHLFHNREQNFNYSEGEGVSEEVAIGDQGGGVGTCLLFFFLFHLPNLD